ncbi:MAG: AAA family ATPase, partial [Planctomycetota bacterium]|nr:AAA family ATPase [Planctomycetota bacterium]
MKLTELAIDRYGACRNVRLDRFTNGLNILFGTPGTGKTSLQEYIRKVLYGFTKDAPQGDGHLICHHEGQSFQLSRPAFATGKLTVANLSAPHVATDAVPKHLQQLGPDLFDTIYHFDSKSEAQSINSILHVLSAHLGVGEENTVCTASPSPFLQTAQSNIVGVDWNSTLAEIRTLENVRSQHLAEVVSNRSYAPTPRVDLEAEIDELSSKIAELDLQPLRDRINTIDAMVRETRELWESAEARNRPSELSTGTGLLSACYDHLDDLDQQIGALRELQSDIQAQRRRRRDELEARIDCEERDAQRAYQPVRDLLKSLQQRLNDAETASRSLLMLPHDGKPAEHPATQVRDGYEEIRKELRQLFADLEQENRKINQRVAAAELRQLRHYHNQIGERLEKLIGRRQLVLHKIQKV